MKYLLVLFIFIGSSIATYSQEPKKNGTAETIYTKTDVMPQFVGGNEKIQEFIFMNLKYPDAAKKEKVQGEVLTQFLVKTDGSLHDVKIIKGVRADIDDEAKRIINSMPKWIPGKKAGKNVDAIVTLPIKFSVK